MSPLSRFAVVLCLSLPLFAACNRRPAAPEPAAPAAAKPALSFDEGLAQARSHQSPLIVDFHAPWCYSCYFMATNILTGADWAAVEKKAVVVEVDADSPDGAALMQKYGIKFLPSYLVLNAGGDELGRILGEKTRAEFYPQINKLVDSGETLDALRATVTDGAPTSVVAGRSVLKSYLARYDAAGGLQWLTTLSADASKALHDDTAAALTIARLQFLQASQQNDGDAVLRIGATVLAGDLGCERPYELDRYFEFASKRPDAHALIAAQQPAAEKLVATGVFGDRPCADKRSAVLSLADIDDALGDQTAKKALLERAIADVEKDLGGDLKKDRNLDDNLRIYNDQLAALTGNYAAYDALMPRLIDAWPDDYVYAARWGKSLLARGDAAQALPQFEKAAEQAYGINRLQVAEQRVKALQALDRDADARRVVADALKANGPWFPDEAARLKALIKA
ncbi:thioredoxin family protein [Solimonas terrae]|uniref:Thioredoxin fold domain-containing protein n=1 Tax=Solimonas terrae TaxID=1396819 RepID=A0A6M2BWL6_9GAMM|nr:thioredoxin family protein [Solimonas terrae]NGY06740.1 thioredoxin fold domain-containing protein [Solimonas terrae]